MSKTISKYYKNKYTTLSELLEMEYPEILENILNENYELTYNNFEIFKEITYENKVVGFYTHEGYKLNSSKRIVNEIYIIPEYRCKGICSKLIWELITHPLYYFYFKKPTKAFINMLLKNKLAIKKNNYVMSYPKFSVDLYEAYRNKNIRKLYHPITENNKKLSIICDMFDYNLCTLIFSDDYSFYCKKSDIMGISSPRSVDMKKYKLKTKLSKINKNYFKKYNNKTDKYMDDFIIFNYNTEDSIDDYLSVESKIGSSDELNDEFKQMLENNNLDLDDGFRIRNHIVRELENDEIIPKSIDLRINYLIHNMDKADLEFNEDIIFDECPVCFEKINGNFDVCDNCGHNISDEEEISHDNVGNPFEKLIESLSNLTKKEEYSDDDEVKKFYDKYLQSYSYHEFNNFVNEHNLSSMEKAVDEFLEYNYERNLKINPYEAYFDYLLSSMYFKLDYDIKETMILTIQFAILISNDYNHMFPKKDANIMENSRSSIDLFFFMEQLPEKIDVDLNECLDSAFETFRLKEYLNNEEEIREEFPKYF